MMRLVSFPAPLSTPDHLRYLCSQPVRACKSNFPLVLNPGRTGADDGCLATAAIACPAPSPRQRRWRIEFDTVTWLTSRLASSLPLLLASAFQKQDVKLPRRRNHAVRACTDSVVILRALGDGWPVSRPSRTVAGRRLWSGGSVGFIDAVSRSDRTTCALRALSRHILHRRREEGRGSRVDQSGRSGSDGRFSYVAIPDLSSPFVVMDDNLPLPPERSPLPPVRVDRCSTASAAYHSTFR